MAVTEAQRIRGENMTAVILLKDMPVTCEGCPAEYHGFCTWAQKQGQNTWRPDGAGVIPPYCPIIPLDEVTEVMVLKQEVRSLRKLAKQQGERQSSSANNYQPDKEIDKNDDL